MILEQQSQARINFEDMDLLQRVKAKYLLPDDKTRGGILEALVNETSKHLGGDVKNQNQ